MSVLGFKATGACLRLVSSCAPFSGKSEVLLLLVAPPICSTISWKLLVARGDPTYTVD